MFVTTDDLFLISLFSFLVWLPCAIYVYRGARLPFYHPISFYVVYHLVGFVVRPLALALLGNSTVWDFMGTAPSAEECFYVAAIAALALVTMVATPAVFAPHLYRDTQFSRFEFIVGSRWGLGISLSLIAVLGVIGALSVTSLSADETTIIQTTTLEGGGRALVGTSGYVTMLAEYLITVVIFVAAVSRVRSIAVAVLLAFVTFRLMQGSGRFAFIAVAVAFGTIEMVRRGMKSPRLVHFAAALALLLAFDVLGTDRLAVRGLIQGSTTIEAVLERYGEVRGPALLTGDFAEFDNAVATMGVVHAKGQYNWGSQYLRLIIWPIPRQLWPNKPVYTDILDFSNYSKVFNIITKTMVADTYSNFGPLAVVLGFAIYSLVLSAIHKAAAHTPRAFLFMAYLSMMGFITLYYRDGIVGGLFFTLISLPAVYLVIKLGKLSLRRFPAAAARAGYVLKPTSRAIGQSAG